MIRLKPVRNAAKFELSFDFKWLPEFFNRWNLADSLLFARESANFAGDVQDKFIRFYNKNLAQFTAATMPNGFPIGWLILYKHRTDEPIRFAARKLSNVKNKVILLNCLDVLYGHSPLKPSTRSIIWTIKLTSVYRHRAVVSNG